jgi:predicted Zn-dependent protease
MAKRLNKKVVYTLAVVGILFLAGVVTFGFRYVRERSPEYCLNKARQAFKAGDFREASGMFGKAYGRTRQDQDKIDILFEMAAFHLTVGEKHEPDWTNALKCWNTVINIDPQHIEARRKLLDYYYQMADSGSDGAWKMVDDNASKLRGIYEKTSQSPDSYVLLSEARAAISIARLGSVANRREMLDKAVKNLEQLKKLAPDDAKVYEYLAEATSLKGELDEVGGLRGAREAAQKEAQQILAQAVSVVSDKGLANANLFEMKIRQAQSDPNLLPAIRKEGQQLIETYPEASRLLALMSFCYELHGKMDRKQEMDMAIQYLEKSIATLEGQGIPNMLRLASLLYRTGNFYQDKNRIQQAMGIAEKAFSSPEATVLPGPKENIARQYRLMIRLFEARCYLEQTLEARQNSEDDAVKTYSEKFNKVVEEIVQFVGENNNLSRLWRGMQILAEDKPDQAYLVLYKIYQDMATQDKPEEVSSVDSYLSYILSRLAARQGSIGMQREFLEKALFNRNSIAPEKPRAILEYAGVMLAVQASQRAADIAKSYIDLYGMDKTAGLLLAQAYVQMNQYDEANTQLDKLESSDPDVLATRLVLASVQANRLAGQLSNAAESSGGDEQAKLKSIRNRQIAALNQMMDIAPEKVEVSILSSMCQEAASRGDLEQVRGWVEKYLSKNPDNTAVLLIKRELAEPDPKTVTSARRLELYEEVMAQIKDPVKKMQAQVRYYRSTGKNEQARELYQNILAAAPDNVEMAGDYFNFLLEQKDVKAAEDVFGKIRNKNPDGCDGRLFAAQLEMSKESYTIAIQRLDECLAQRPTLSVAAVLKSQIHQRQGKFDAAVEAAKSAFQMDPRNPTAARQLASVLFDRNRDLGSRVTAEQAAEAERAVGVAMVLSPSDWQLQSVYAETVSEHDPQQALAMRQSLLKTVPNVNNAVMLGNMAIRMARAEADAAKRDALVQMAGDAYQRGWQIDPNASLIQLSYAEFLRLTGQRQKAAELFANTPQILWRFYLADGQYDQATATLEKLYKETPDNVDILQGLIEAAAGLNQSEQMKIYLDAMARKELTSEQDLWLIEKILDAGFNDFAEKELADFQSKYPSDNRVQLLRAWLEMTRGNLELAMEKTDQFLAKETNNASAWRLKGRIYRLLDQPQQAIDALLRSKNITPDPAVGMELATLYSQTHQIEAAAGELNNAMQNPQASPQVRRTLESLYQENKRWNELIQFYKQTLEKFPEDPFWTTRFGLFYLGQKEYNNAIPLLEKAWNLTRKNSAGDPMALDNYLGAMIAADKLDAAIAMASKYVDGPMAPVAYWSVAVIQAKQNQTQKAIETFSKAIEKTVDSPGLLMPALSVMGRTLGETSVEKWCTDKLATDPSFIPAHLILAGIAEQAGAYNKALTHINLCLDKTPQNSVQWMEFSSRKANILLRAYAKTADAGYLKQSISQLEAHLKLQPNDITVMNNLAYLLAENDIELDKAVDYARRAYQRAPGNAVLLDTYAFALCKTSDFAQAEKYITQVLLSYQRSGTTPPWDVYKHQGMAFVGLKKKKEAIAAFQKAVELGKEIPDKEKQYLEKTIESLK